MYLIQGQNRVRSLLLMYEAVRNGVVQQVRGQEVRNVRNLTICLNMVEGGVFTNFKARNFNLHYAKREWIWYLGADPYDDSIEKYASMWKKLQQPDGSYYSNYGQYMFGPDPNVTFQTPSQFDYVVDTLKKDEFSRRASMMLLHREHLFGGNSDVVCTYAINFAIEDSRLHMTVMMRSNDVIFGFTNDAFCFSQLYEFVYKRLSDEKYPYLQYGTYTHMANSMHVYQRHFEMIDKIVEDGPDGFVPVIQPELKADEARDLVKSRGKVAYGAYTQWLQTGP